jgi:hypothetical protein
METATHSTNIGVVLVATLRDTRSGIGFGRKTGSEAGEAICWGHFLFRRGSQPEYLGDARNRDSSTDLEFLSTLTDEAYGGTSGPLPSPLHL